MTWSYLPGHHTPHTQNNITAGDPAEVTAGQLTLDHPAATAPQTDVDRRFYALVTDHLGTPTALLDPTTGTLAGHATTTMRGHTTWTGTDTPWRYPGQYHDPETGLHYNHHRYYHPHSGRYLSPDPLGLAPAPNPCGYPANPTTFIDPHGLNPCEGTGTVWDHIRPIQPPFPGTPVPRSFELRTTHGDVWIHPNALDHFPGIIKNLGDHGTPAWQIRRRRN